jgi:type IV pilus assembly protein PilM
MSDSIWKKEISFGKKQKQPKQPKEPKEPKEEKQSIWKKEIGGPRKKKDDDAVARLVELATQTVDPAFVPVAAEPVTPPTEVAEAVLAAEQPVVDLAPELQPVAVHPTEAAPFSVPVGVPDLSLGAAPPAAAPLDTVLEPAPVEAWMEPEPVESWLGESELPPAAEADTAVVVHPPVPAAALPPLPEDKVPFWKKEVSFGKKAKAAAPAPAPAPAHEQAEPVQAEKVPFWKKELGGKAKQPKTAKAPKAPRARRSLSLPKLSLPSFSRGGRHQVKRYVGLKIGGSQLAAARVSNNGVAELLQVVRAPLDAGVVVAGELRDPDTLANALKDFFAKNKLPRKNVRLGIASNRIGVRMFDISGIDDAKQLENAVHFRAQEALPIPLDEAVLDYHVLEEKVDDEGVATKRVLLVVAYRELVDRYVAACKKAGITLAGIDLEAFALLRALSAPKPDGEVSDSALVAVAVGHDRSTFAVSNGRVCEFTRVLDWGGSALNVAIARALDLAPSEAEAIKRAVSLASPDVPEGVAPEHYALAVDAVRKQVQAFARELVSSLQFYQNQPGSLGIGEIVITGGTANLVGLADELQRLIGVHVRVGDPLARLKVTKKVALDEPLGSLAVAIGLGIED